MAAKEQMSGTNKADITSYNTANNTSSNKLRKRKLIVLLVAVVVVVCGLGYILTKDGSKESTSPTASKSVVWTAFNDSNLLFSHPKSWTAEFLAPLKEAPNMKSYAITSDTDIKKENGNEFKYSAQLKLFSNSQEGRTCKNCKVLDASDITLSAHKKKLKILIVDNTGDEKPDAVILGEDNIKTGDVNFKSAVKMGDNNYLYYSASYSGLTKDGLKFIPMADNASSLKQVETFKLFNSLIESIYIK